MKKIIIIITTLILVIILLILLINYKPLNNIKYMDTQNAIKNRIIRPPYFAGKFYPENKDVLNNLINSFIQKTEPSQNNLKPQIIISPHAGYVFSGQTAISSFILLQNFDYNNIIIIGPSHQQIADNLLIYTGNAISTPLGQINTNPDINQVLLSNKYCQADNQAHQNEHSIEVQIPLLQKTIKTNWRINMGLINTNDQTTLTEITETITRIISQTPNTLLVISSDLSHYPNYQNANLYDKKIIDAILSKNTEKLDQEINLIKTQNIPGLETCACGLSPIKIAMAIASKLNLTGKLVHYSNSGDSDYGDKNNVVGYGSIVFFKTELDSQQLLNQTEQKIAMDMAINAIKQKLNLTTKKNNSIEYKNHPIFMEPRGLFITLYKNNQLRGCIGLIEPVKKLYQAIPEMAASAAFNDPRFKPLSADELDQIKIEISVLSPLEKIDDINQIKLGQHGVVIKSNQNSGVFLPQVAVETNWTKQQFLEHLCSDKAGLNKNCYLEPETDIYIFSTQSFK